MKKVLFSLVLLIFSFPAFSVSSKPERKDGIGRVTLKNGYPCFYLNNGKAITNIQFSGQKNPEGFDPTGPDGSSRDKCVPFFNGIPELPKYNESVGVLLMDESARGNLEYAHAVYFCVEKRGNTLRLVHEAAQGGCSAEPWKPVKKYGSGFFGKIEEMWDRFFKLNGYTEETF